MGTIAWCDGAPENVQVSVKSGAWRCKSRQTAVPSVQSSLSDANLKPSDHDFSSAVALRVRSADEGFLTPSTTPDC